MKHKCVIFDCDGVLVDSEAISAKVFGEMISELGFDLDFNTIVEQITGTSMKNNLKFFEKTISQKLPQNFEDEFRKRSYQLFKAELKPIPGVRELLEKLCVPIGVASSGPQEKIRQNLSTTGLISYFDKNIFSSYDIKSWKPEPEIYLHAAGEMGFRPSDCAIIEDSEPGVRAAKAGGFDVFAIANRRKTNAFKRLGATVFENMKELERILNLETSIPG